MGAHFLRTAAVVAGALLFAITCGASSGELTARGGSAVDSCAVRVASTNRLNIAGNPLHVATRAFAFQDGEIFLAGTPTLVFTRETGDWRYAIPHDSLLGVIVSADGSTRVVHDFIPNRPGAQARVAPAGNGRWHVIAIDSAKGHSREPSYIREVDVWYALYDGKSWSGVEKVGTYTYALLGAEQSSALVADAGDLRMAFSFDRSDSAGTNSRGNIGFIVLRRIAGKWSTDSTYHPFNADRVRMFPNHPGAASRWLVTMGTTYREMGALTVGSSFLVADYDSSWTQPKPIALHYTGGVWDGNLAFAGGQFAASWQRRGDSTRIQASLLAPGSLKATDEQNAFPGFVDNALATFGSNDFVVLSNVQRNKVFAALLRAGKLTRLPEISMEGIGPDPTVVRIHPDTTVYTTSVLGNTDAEAPGQTLLHKLVLTCR